MEQLELEEYIDRVEAEQKKTNDRVRGSGVYVTSWGPQEDYAMATGVTGSGVPVPWPDVPLQVIPSAPNGYSVSVSGCFIANHDD